jgi:hypothetical protein
MKIHIIYKEILVLWKKSLHGHRVAQKFLTRAPMFGMSLPFSNYTSISNKEVLYR